MHFDRRLVGFGLFLITVGAVMIAVRQGLVGEDDARKTWTLWPLILVGVGLSIVLAGRPGAAIGGIVLALTLGAMVGGVAATGVFPGVGFCGSSRADPGTAFAPSSGGFGASALVTVSEDCGDLTVGTVAGSTWNVSGETSDGRPPLIDQSPSSFRVRTRDGTPFDLGGASRWSVVVPRDPAIDLAITINGGQGRITLAGANVSTLRVDANAGSIDVDLREVSAFGDATVDVNFGSATLRLPNRSLTGSLSINAGSAALCIPDGAGLRVRIDGAAASNDFAGHGLIETNGVWETPGFDNSAVRLDLRAHVSAGSLAFDPSRQCAG